MGTKIELNDLVIDVVKKKIKNLHLSVHPPEGRVTISAPLRMSINNVRIFAISKLDWIKKQQKKIQEQIRETPREYLDRESHYVWGNRYLLKVVEKDAAPAVTILHNKLILQVRPNTDEKKRQVILEEWYREEITKALIPMIAKWEGIMGVTVRKFFVRRMKTKWGTCNYKAGNVRFNTDLARKNIECLEYVVVHELAHLIEHSHNEKFIALMDKFMPKWRFYRDELNRLPLRHESWEY